MKYKFFGGVSKNYTQIYVFLYVYPKSLIRNKSVH